MRQKDTRWAKPFEPVVPWAGDFSAKGAVPTFFALFVEMGAA